MGALDGFMMLVPRDWTVPGGSQVPSTTNKGNRDGRLEPVPHTVGDLLKSGSEPPGALFRAEAVNASGARLGVVVGVYETESPDPLGSVREQVPETSPGAEVTEIGVFRRSGLLVAFPDGVQSRGEQVVRDYWATAPGSEHTAALIRCWRDGPQAPGDEAWYEGVGGSALFMAPGGKRSRDAIKILGHYGLPSEDEPAEPGRWRYAGWRLGTVFHTGLIPAKGQHFNLQAGFNQRHGYALLGVFVAWLVIAWATIGWNTGIFLAGGMAFASGVTMLRKGGMRAVAAIAILLVVLLGAGVLFTD